VSDSKHPPLAGPAGSEQFGSLSDGEAALYPVLEAPLPFTFSIDLNGVSLTHLRTSGFGLLEGVPALATEPLAVPVRFATPGLAKLIQEAGDIPMPPLPMQLPEIQLRTIGPKMVTGVKTEPKHVFAAAAVLVLKVAGCLGFTATARERI
jgi:hypothetical protein